MKTSRRLSEMVARMATRVRSISTMTERFPALLFSLTRSASICSFSRSPSKDGVSPFFSGCMSYEYQQVCGEGEGGNSVLCPHLPSGVVVAVPEQVAHGVLDHVAAQGSHLVGAACDGLHQPRVRVEEAADEVVLRQHRHRPVVRRMQHLPPLLSVPVQVLGKGLVHPRRVEGHGRQVEQRSYYMSDSPAEGVAGENYLMARRRSRENSMADVADEAIVLVLQAR